MQLQHLRTYSGHRGGLYCLQPSWREGYFLSCGSDGYISEWDVLTGEGKAILHCPGALFSLYVDVKTGFLAAGTQTGLLYFADLKSQKVIKAFETHTKGIFDFIALPDGILVASGGDGALTFWNLATLQQVGRKIFSSQSIRTMVLNNEGNLMLGSSDGKISQLNSQFEISSQWEAHKTSVFRLLFSSAKDHLYSVGRDAYLNVWDVSNQLLTTLPAHNYAINDLVAHPELSILFTGSMDKTIKIWNADPLTLVKVADRARNGVHANGVNRLLWMGDRLYSCSDDRTVMEWVLT